MTEHSIEELKRQVRRAAEKEAEGRKEHEEAKKRLHEARVKQTGAIGKTISHNGVSIVVHDVYFGWTDQPFYYKGYALKKDGTVGRQERTIYHSRVEGQI